MMKNRILTALILALVIPGTWILCMAADEVTATFGLSVSNPSEMEYFNQQTRNYSLDKEDAGIQVIYTIPNNSTWEMITPSSDISAGLTIVETRWTNETQEVLVSFNGGTNTAAWLKGGDVFFFRFNGNNAAELFGLKSNQAGTFPVNITLLHDP